MDVRQLTNFLTVVKLKSLSRAARSLGIGQPALGLQIRALEHELRATLVRRHSRGVEPTQAGLILARHIGPILAAVDAAQDTAPGSNAEETSVRIGMTSSAGVTILPELTKVLSRELPRTKCKIVVDAPARLLSRLHASEIELVCAYGSKPYEGFSCEALYEDILCLVTSDEAHRGRKHIAFSDAMACSLILSEPSDLVRQDSDLLTVSPGFSFNIAMLIDSQAVALEAVLHGVGDAILPSRMVPAVRRMGGPFVLHITQPDLPCSLYMMRPSNSELRQTTDAVAELIRRAVAVPAVSTLASRSQ